MLLPGALLCVLPLFAGLSAPIDLEPGEWLVVEGAGEEVEWIQEAVRARYLLPAEERIPSADETFIDTVGRRRRWTGREGFPGEAGGVACAYGRLERPADEVRMVAASGVERIFVNGAPYLGDAERRGGWGVPIPLREGSNHSFVEGGTAGF